jgi:hypothetical protein
LRIRFANITALVSRSRHADIANTFCGDPFPDEGQQDFRPDEVVHLHELDEIGPQSSHGLFHAGEAFLSSFVGRRDFGREEGFRAVTDFREQFTDHALRFAVERGGVDDA